MPADTTRSSSNAKDEGTCDSVNGKIQTWSNSKTAILGYYQHACSSISCSRHMATRESNNSWLKADK